MNLFTLAELQLQREGKKVSDKKVVAYAVKIRKWLDKHRGVANAILAGGVVYQYGNRFIVSK